MKVSKSMQSILLISALITSPLVLANSTTQNVMTPSSSTAVKSTASIDTGLKADVKKKLLGDKTLDGSKINVSIHKGIVTLHGIVKDQSQIDAAITDAKSVTGVLDVKSKITLKKG